jgi:NAD(P)H-flavin reductase
MVPLMCILRHHMNNLDSEYEFNSQKMKERDRKIVFIISARTFDLVLYKQELEEIQKKDHNVKIITTLTDSHPDNWIGYTRRIDKDMLQETIASLKPEMAMSYICGPTKFVEATATNMIELGFNPHTIKTERFGG